MISIKTKRFTHHRSLLHGSRDACEDSSVSAGGACEEIGETAALLQLNAPGLELSLATHWFWRREELMYSSCYITFRLSSQICVLTSKGNAT